MYRITFISIFLCLVMSLNAQNLKREVLENEKIGFFTQKLNLTPAEAEKFWPLYNDYSNRKLRIQNERNGLRKYYMRNGENLSEKECKEMADKYVDLNVKEASLSKDYHPQFLKILPAKKLAQLYVAEEQFKTYLLRKLKKQRPPKKGRRGM